MFDVKLNEESHSIQVTYFDESNMQLIIAANGCYLIDRVSHIALVVITYITISSNDNRLHQFLSSILSHVGQIYRVGVFLRLSMFDGQINMDKLQFKNMYNNIMAVTTDHIKHDNDLIQFDQEHYALITDKEILLDYSQQLTIMINENEFAAKQWNSEETQNRINVASYVAMMIDKTKNVPCGIGRLLMIKSKNDCKETFGYLSTIGIDRYHQKEVLVRL
jgi:hypothetical protein